MSNPTATNPANHKPFRDDEWFYSDNNKVRACFTFIGEGYSGDYDPSDPTDAALYRLDVNVAAEYREDVWGEEIDDEPEWVYPSDGSICTGVEVEKYGEYTLIDLLVYAANSVADAITSGTTSVKHTMDDLSYLPTKR